MMPDDPNELQRQQWLSLAMVLGGVTLLVFTFALQWPAGLVRLGMGLLFSGFYRLLRKFFRDVRTNPAPTLAGIGHTVPEMTIAPESPAARRFKAALLLVPAAAILAFGMQPSLMPFGGIVARMCSVLIAYGLYKMAQINGLIGPARAGAIEHRYSALARFLLRRQITGQPNPLGQVGEMFWRMGQGLGVVLVAVMLPCLVAFWSKTPTVVIAGDFDSLDGTTMLALLTVAMFVGASCARLVATSLPKFLFKSLFLGFTAFSLMMVPIVLTGSQIAEFQAFHGKTTTARQEFRIWWGYRHGGRNIRNYALINPDHIEQRETRLLPEIPVTADAFQIIRNANPDGPIDDSMIFYHPDHPVKTSDLCLSFIAERAGPYERILLGTPGDIPAKALHSCGANAR